MVPEFVPNPPELGKNGQPENPDAFGHVYRRRYGLTVCFVCHRFGAPEDIVGGYDLIRRD